ncbi:hypothetical protein PENTCL1PPCAC_12091, partial [Pristionchus entomophagus]
DVALGLSMKKVFGVVDNKETRQEKFENAMTALENIEIGRDDKEMASLIGRIRDLAIDMTTFYYFNRGLNEAEYSMWIRPIEVVPAVEVLYIQYRTLKNKKGKEFVCKYLGKWKNHFEMSALDNNRMLINYKDFKSNTQSDFYSLPEVTVSALITTFPELFEYLYKNN